MTAHPNDERARFHGCVALLRSFSLIQHPQPQHSQPHSALPFPLQHDFMGQIVLPLGRLASGEPVAFDEPVLLSSVVKGRLAGTLQLQWPAGSTTAVAAAAPLPAETASPASPAEGRAAVPTLASPVGGSVAEGKEWGARPSTPKAHTGCGSLCQVQ